MAESSIDFTCADCGSATFVLPNNPPKDDDIVSCAGSQKEIGRYDVIRAAAIKAGKTGIDNIVVNAFCTKPKW